MPKSWSQTLFFFVLAFVGIYCYASVTASVASLAANLDVAAESFYRRLDLLRKYMVRKRLPQQLQDRMLV